MDISDLHRKAWEAWRDYGHVICEAFHFPKGSQIIAEPLLEVISQGSEEDLRNFIAYVQERTADLRNAPFIGEDDNNGD